MKPTWSFGSSAAFLRSIIGCRRTQVHPRCMRTLHWKAHLCFLPRIDLLWHLGSSAMPFIKAFHHCPLPPLQGSEVLISFGTSAEFLASSFRVYGQEGGQSVFLLCLLTRHLRECSCNTGLKRFSILYSLTEHEVPFILKALMIPLWCLCQWRCQVLLKKQTGCTSGGHIKELLLSLSMPILAFVIIQ